MSSLAWAMYAPPTGLLTRLLTFASAMRLT